MGATYSINQLAISPAATVCYVQKPMYSICKCDDICDFEQEYRTKPPVLQNTLVDDETWQRMVREVGELCKRLHSQGKITLFMIIFTLPIPLIVILQNLQGTRELRNLGAGTWALAMGLVIFVVHFLTGQNRKIDLQIQQCLNQYTDRYTSAQMMLEYRTMHTGTCKPKHAKTMRAVVITPTQIPGMIQGVPVPAGTAPGMPVQGMPSQQMMPGQPMMAPGGMMMQPGMQGGVYAQPGAPLGSNLGYPPPPIATPVSSNTDIPYAIPQAQPFTGRAAETAVPVYTSTFPAPSPAPAVEMGSSFAPAPTNTSADPTPVGQVDRYGLQQVGQTSNYSTYTSTSGAPVVNTSPPGSSGTQQVVNTSGSESPKERPAPVVS